MATGQGLGSIVPLGNVTSRRKRSGAWRRRDRRPARPPGSGGLHSAMHADGPSNGRPYSAIWPPGLS
jgi:hypothetical protein